MHVIASSDNKQVRTVQLLNTACGSGLRYKLSYVCAEPVYENGELQHGGSDLDLKGSLPYYAVETIYCLALLQVLTAVLSDKFWWMLLAVSKRTH